MGKMDGIGYHLEPNDRVRLRNTVDPGVYGDFACVGNEGWVMDRRQDRFDLPEVLIRWDHNHWAYNGAPDVWTFEEHFELVEVSMDKQEVIQQAALDFASKIASAFGDETPQEEPPSAAKDLTARMVEAGKVLGVQAEEEEDEYAQAIAMGHEGLGQAEAFIIIGVRKTPQGRLDPFAMGNARTPQSELAVETHLAGVAARAHQELAIKVLTGLTGDES